MVDANEEFVSISYTYYKGEEGPVDGMVDVPKGMDNLSAYINRAAAHQIATTLREQGQFVCWNGQAVIGGTDRVDKSSSVDIVVDVVGSSEKLTLQVYAGAPMHPVKDQ